MSVRRENIEEQAMRLRHYVSEAVCAATGSALPMTQTLDQMVRTAAKAGVLLSISTDQQSHAIEMLSNELRLVEMAVDQLKAENEALIYDCRVANSVVNAERQDARRYRWLRDRHNDSNSDLGVYDGHHILRSDAEVYDLNLDKSIDLLMNEVASHE